jgi:hypothetical protein
MVPELSPQFKFQGPGLIFAQSKLFYFQTLSENNGHDPAFPARNTSKLFPSFI